MRRGYSRGAAVRGRGVYGRRTVVAGRRATMAVAPSTPGAASMGAAAIMRGALTQGAAIIMAVADALRSRVRLWRKGLGWRQRLLSGRRRGRRPERLRGREALRRTDRWLQAQIGDHQGNFGRSPLPRYWRLQSQPMPSSISNSHPAGTTVRRTAGRESSPGALSSGAIPVGGRPIVAWAHPTSGLVPRCAPSLAIFLFRQIQGLRDMVRRGYIVAATDYPGLGTPGQHPYLVLQKAA